MEGESPGKVKHLQGRRKKSWLMSWAIASFLLWAFAPNAKAAQAARVREADAACALCHKEIYDSYLITPMANASGLATDRLVPGSFLHAASGVQYQLSVEQGSAWLSYAKPNDPAIHGKERLEYFLGSGHLGLTYLYEKEGYLLESPVAYYAGQNAYDMKPGLGKIDHMPGALTLNATCLRCHMSAVQRADPGTEDHYRGLPFLQVGITCESCHGDTRRHVETRGIAQVVDPAKLAPANRDSVCILCHLEGVTSVERAGHSVLDFQPGDDIATYMSYFRDADSSLTRRGVSEVEQFMSSKCKRVSGAKMSCTSCHDPHRAPAASERAAFYRAKCLVCHSGAKFAEAHYPGQPDCTGCHMPKTGADNIPHVAWTDHRILRTTKELGDPSASPRGDRQLISILNGNADTRDLALAYYNLAVNGDPTQRSRATSLLTDAAQMSPDDPAVLRALAILDEWNGESARAEQLYRRLLVHDPDSLTAMTNLGTLLARSGRFTEAAALWQPAFSHNEDVVALGENLATLECRLGQKQSAAEVLRRVLVFSPDLPNIKAKLKAIESGAESCAP